MKIRIKSNALRYRLTRSEVARFADTGLITEEINFGDAKLTYILRVTDQEQLSASFGNNVITLNMPANIARKWTDTDAVGFDNGDSHMFLQVEKDFQCLDNVDEDQSDNYPNPLAFK